MSKLEKVYNIFQSLKTLGIVIGGIGTFAMMFFIVADVISRNFLSGSIKGSIEFVQYYIMPLAIIPGMAYVYGTGILPRLELLIDKLQGSVRNLIVNIFLIFEIVLFSIVVVYSTQYAFSGIEMSSSFSAGGTIYPYYPLLFLVPAIFIIINLELVFILIRNVQKKRGSFKFYTDDDSMPKKIIQDQSTTIIG